MQFEPRFEPKPFPLKKYLNVIEHIKPLPLLHIEGCWQLWPLCQSLGGVHTFSMHHYGAL